MTRLDWSAPEDRIFQTGLDRGVLYLKDGRPAVTWSGLSSVDEAGGESPSTYYIDGRPFLHLPKPKEFSANIKAYTYPDEFNSIMGIVEASGAKGMYLDSQMGETFDLSYRTLVGDAVSGLDLGYKIHLVYNATVAPDSMTFASLSNSVNPIEFGWNIRAVPVLVDGYRPTAHIILDTRNMESEQLEAIEIMLYGDATHSAYMPQPQELYDLLKFAGAIIITDMGGGLWSAEGSYQNIYMIGDEIFQIDNVDAIDHGDGTYTISTTNA